MTTLAPKIPLSGSAFRGLSGSLLLGVMALTLLACSHSPARETASLGSVRFAVESPDAIKVDLVLLSGRNDRPAMTQIQARRMDEGVWKVEMDLIPGEYRYFFLVDGALTVNSNGNRVEKDDFGGVTGVLRVSRDASGEIQVY